MPLNIDTSADYTLTVRRSRFEALVVPAQTIDEVKSVVDRRRRTHRKARHHCWACRVLSESGALTEQARDDGEVGRPGMVLLELLRRHDLHGGLIVSRFFGGVKLGPGGVSRAIREAAQQALSRLGI